MKLWKIMSGPLHFHRAEATFYNGIETKFLDRLIVSGDRKDDVFHALIDLKEQIETMIRNWESEDD